MENVYLCSVNGALRMRPTNERKRISTVEMKMSEQTLQQVERALRKVAAKFPTTSGHTPLTDIYLQVTPESGELRAYDDEDVELTRCVVEEWIDYRGEDFDEMAEQVLRRAIGNLRELLDGLNILKPYSFVLLGEDHEVLTDLYLVDDDTLLVGGELMEGLNEDLDSFLDKLLKD